MYMENFIKALDAFDAEMDRLARLNPPKTTPKPPIVDMEDDVDILDDVKQVIYNDPATIVTFADGSKVCVKACQQDQFNKEVGLLYAIVKRLYANDIDKDGYLKSTGLGDKMTTIVNCAIDQKAIKEAKSKERAKKKSKKNKR